MVQTRGAAFRRTSIRIVSAALLAMTAAGCSLLGPSGPTTPAVWRLDPAHPSPGPEATEVDLLIMETACASGTDPRSRIGTPEIVRGDTSLTITIPIHRLSGDADCQGNGEYPYRLSLGEKLGDRALRGGDGPHQARDATPTPAP